MCPEGIEFTEGNIVYLVFYFAVAEEKRLSEVIPGNYCVRAKHKKR